MKRLKQPLYIWQHPHWPRFSWDVEILLNPLSQARKAQGRLIQAMMTLGLDSTQNQQAEILIDETLNTASIEGERYDRNAVRSSVARHLGLPTTGLPLPTRDIDGLVDVLQEATMHFKKPLTSKRLKSWQASLFPTGYSGLHKIKTGQWRGKAPMQVVSGRLGKERVHFEAPPCRRLSKEMRRFLSWWNKGTEPKDGLLRAGVAHFYFVTIHPFEDGNGRLARALTDMALAQDENISQRFYSLSSRIMVERKHYYDVLEKCQKGSLDITAWLEWFLSCLLRAIQDSERLISITLGKARFWERHSMVSLSARQRKVLNRLLDAGPAGFLGGLTTRKYTALTKASRATAFREISELVENGMLQALEGRGRSMAYELIWP